MTFEQIGESIAGNIHGIAFGTIIAGGMSIRDAVLGPIIGSIAGLACVYVPKIFKFFKK